MKAGSPASCSAANFFRKETSCQLDSCEMRSRCTVSETGT